MTSTIQFPTYIIGLMSGTSADGVDAALLFTDGREMVRAHESAFVGYDDALRAQILALMQGNGDEAAIAHALTEVHIAAVEKLLMLTKIPRAEVRLIGFHGQTIRHDPAHGITRQIGDAALLAARTGIAVVADFRSNDVAHGGQGAPLVPMYHAALADHQPKPVMIVNIGGVSNVTWIGDAAPEGASVGEAKAEPPSSNKILAFDCGPGNALLDDWVQKHTGERYDRNGALAAQGEVDEGALKRFLAHPFFVEKPPKSLDRNAFTSLVHVSEGGGGEWKVEDGAATLTAMTAAGIAHACSQVPVRPAQLILCGGGRHNPTLVRMIAERSGCAVIDSDALGWDGDMLEAEAFAYLAARSAQGLPLSLPTTTGVREAVSGGTLFEIEAPHHHDDDDDCTSPRSCCR